MTKSFNMIPYMIVGGLLLFMMYILQFVYRSMGDDTNLVSKDYYKKEIAYQDHIDKLERSFEMKKNTAISVADDLVLVELPKEIEAAAGTIYMYNPVDPLLDQQVSFNFDSYKPIQVPTKGMKAGDWTIKIDFATGGKTYYIERPITL